MLWMNLRRYNAIKVLQPSSSADARNTLLAWSARYGQIRRMNCDTGNLAGRCDRLRVGRMRPIEPREFRASDEPRQDGFAEPPYSSAAKGLLPPRAAFQKGSFYDVSHAPRVLGTISRLSAISPRRMRVGPKGCRQTRCFRREVCVMQIVKTVLATKRPFSEKLHAGKLSTWCSEGAGRKSVSP